MDSSKLSMWVISLMLLSSSLSKRCGVESCKRGFGLDIESCTCKQMGHIDCPIRICPPNTYLDPDCNCYSYKTCGLNDCFRNFISDFNRCECIDITPPLENCKINECQAGFALHEGCLCFPENMDWCQLQCKQGFSVSPGKCLCEKTTSCPITSCQDPTYLDDYYCNCEYPQDYCDITCEPGTVWEFPCQCVPESEIAMVAEVQH